ncbi:MAG: hypothetical protein MUP82_06415 [Candidatus Marinimicrobia bacterium]|jgi:hypothetical protein|nr:hypothetical protein [Candidatus Neomarinimicrobiota bacterium]
MNNSQAETYKFTFKLAYTKQTKKYTIDPSMSITKFIQEIKDRARPDFDLKFGETVEIVEAGQYNNIHGHDAERAPALVESDHTIGDLYADRHNITSFYIRKLCVT